MSNPQGIRGYQLTAGLMASGFLLILLTSGCASSQSNLDRIIQATEHINDPMRTLEARAELELGQTYSPIDEAQRLVFLPNSPSPIQMGTARYRKAMLKPDAVISSLDSAARTPPPDNTDVTPTDPRRVKQATKLYTQARALRQQGQQREAIELLGQAIELDPASASSARELGDCLILTNDRVGALVAFERAYSLGERNPRMLVHLASLEASRGNRQRAILLAHQARQSPGMNRFPMANAIAGIIEGTAKIDDGYLRSGSLVLAESLDLFNDRSRDVRWKREIIEIVNQRSSLWLRIGDAWNALGANDQATHAYQRASLNTNQSTRSLVARNLVSLLENGREANAAILFLDYLENNATKLMPQDLQWARTLSAYPSVGDTLGMAICSLADQSETPSLGRSLAAIGLEALTLDQAILQIIAFENIRVDQPILIPLFDRAGNDAEQVLLSKRILQANPNLAQDLASALVLTVQDPIAVLKANPGASDSTSQLLAAAIGVSLGRADLIDHLDQFDQTDLSTFAEHSSAWLWVHARANALSGRWASANAMINELESRLSRSTDTESDLQLARHLASALLVGGRSSDAWSMIQPIANSADASIEDLLLGASIAHTLSHRASSAAFLERAIELDPYDEIAYQQLLLVRAPTGQNDDPEDLKIIIRQLAGTRPHSPVLQMIRANELAQAGYLDEAQARIVELNTQNPYAQLGLDFLLSLWKTMSVGKNPDALSDGVHWLQSQLDEHPNGVERSLRTAQGLLELGKPTQAITILNRCYQLTGSFEIARAIEAISNDPEINLSDDHATGLKKAQTRLVDLRGIDPVIEYASILAANATQSDTDKLIDHLNNFLPTSIELLPSQRTKLAQVVFTLARSIEQLNNEASILEVISIIDTRVQSLGFQLSRIRVLLLASLPEMNIDELVAVVIRSVEESDTDEQRDLLRALPIQSLLGEDRSHEAIVLITRFATLENTLDTDYIIETFRLIAGVGVNSDLIGLMNTLETTGLLDQTIELTTTELGTPDRGKQAKTSDEKRADLAYTAAALTTAFERPQQASKYYELSLSYDPDHAWSNNDYGYMLAENGERIAYAAELLERAANALPGEASIIDSLGWVRYKMGIFKDQLDEHGQVIVEGAITLLTLANELDTKRENATILMHLGDALWRGNQREQAINAWVGAEDIARSQIRTLGERENPNQRAIEAMREELRGIRYRIQDAENTGEPEIAPISSKSPIPEPESETVP